MAHSAAGSLVCKEMCQIHRCLSIFLSLIDRYDGWLCPNRMSMLVTTFASTKTQPAVITTASLDHPQPGRKAIYRVEFAPILSVQRSVVRIPFVKILDP